jgi:hypothetical protein
MSAAVDEVTCDDEASVASKTKPDNQSLGVTVFVRLTGNTPQEGANNIASARRTAIHLTGIMISPVRVKGQPFPLSHCCHIGYSRMTGYSPGNKRVSRLFLVTTDGAKRRPVLRTRKTDDVE